MTVNGRKKTGKAGSARERQVVAHYRDRGFVAFRTPASLGVCDVVAMKAYEPWWGPEANGMPTTLVYFTEVKANTGNPYMNFRKRDRLELLEAAKRAGAIPLLAHWPPAGELRLIGADEWPNHNGGNA